MSGYNHMSICWLVKASSDVMDEEVVCETALQLSGAVRLNAVLVYPHPPIAFVSLK
jgi:hypothetical protein